MNTLFRTTLIVTSVIIAAVLLLATGLWIGRTGWGMTWLWPGSMMSAGAGYSSGMMSGSTMMNQGMMNQGGMMGSPDLYPRAALLSLEEAETALDRFLQSNQYEDLVIGEIMIFENHAYAQLIEKSTGIGAMEVLIDPTTLAVRPEHGPNMMWNLKYGMMAGYGSGSMGNMMNGGRMRDGMMAGGMGLHQHAPGTLADPVEISADMPVSPDEAVESAQRYLDIYLPGTLADDHADQFYGYYTLHILRDGEVAGMLSVNGFSRQVFLHTWHGDFVGMSEH